MDENDEIIPTKLGLTKGNKDDLERVAGKGGVSDEVRRRLTASFQDDKLSPATRQLIDAIKYLSRTFDLEDRWNENQFSFEVFQAAVMEILKRFEPGGPAKVGPEHVGVFFSQGDDPGTAGRMLARLAMESLGPYSSINLMKKRND